MKRVLLVLVVLVGMTAPTTMAARPALKISPVNVKFGKQQFETFTKKSFTITNRTSENLLVSIEPVRVPDDFSPGQIESTCTLSFSDTLLRPGETCTHVIGFRPTPFFAGRELAILRVVARDEAGNIVYEQEVSITGTGV